MLHFIRLAYPVPARPSRAGMLPTVPAFVLASVALLFMVAATAHAQFGAPPAGTQIHDASSLHPPAGSRVAIVEFYDLECPACAAANPMLMQAAATYKIPWVHHDFLIPGHIWSPIAAVTARWFDSKSKALGDEYRNQVFANQNTIYNPGALSQFTQKFAQNHGISLPFAIDPQGKLAADVKADTDLGRRAGIMATPAIFVVTSNGAKGSGYVEVTDHSKLYQIIDQAINETKQSPPHK